MLHLPGVTVKSPLSHCRVQTLLMSLEISSDLTVAPGNIYLVNFNVLGDKIQTFFIIQLSYISIFFVFLSRSIPASSVQRPSASLINSSPILKTTTIIKSGPGFVVFAISSSTTTSNLRSISNNIQKSLHSPVLCARGCLVTTPDFESI